MASFEGCCGLAGGFRGDAGFPLDLETLLEDLLVADRDDTVFTLPVSPGVFGLDVLLAAVLDLLETATTFGATVAAVFGFVTVGAVFGLDALLAIAFDLLCMATTFGVVVAAVFGSVIVGVVFSLDVLLTIVFGLLAAATALGVTATVVFSLAVFVVDLRLVQAFSQGCSGTGDVIWGFMIFPFVLGTPLEDLLVVEGGNSVFKLAVSPAVFDLDMFFANVMDLLVMTASLGETETTASTLILTVFLGMAIAISPSCFGAVGMF